MAELAPGAVNALLGIIRNEAQLLSGVENDVQFIKEEMESMNSFLQHLSRTKPPGGEHDEQVRTWMKQVRDLAYACSNSIDTYLQRGDPAAVLAARGRLGYLWRVIPWNLQKLYAQHRAAAELRELKDRARDVGKRRLRYGVEIPTSKKPTTTSPATSPSQTQAADGGDEGIIPGDDERPPEDEAMRARALSEPRLLEECTRQLVRWLRYTQERAPYLEDRLQAIAIAAPDEYLDGADVASEAWAHPLVEKMFEHKFWITSKYKQYGFLETEPLDILRHIQKDLQEQEQQEQEQEQEQQEQEQEHEQDQEQEQEVDRKIENIMEKIEDYVRAGKRSCADVRLELDDIVDPVDATDTSVKIYQMDKMIIETAKKLKVHMEKGKEKSWIGLDLSEYEGILLELLHVLEDSDKLDEAQMLDEKIIETLENIKELLVIKEAAEKIKKHLKPQKTLIVIDGHDNADTWGKIKKALNMLGCPTGSAVIVITKNQPKDSGEFCNTLFSPISYSLVGFYHNKVLSITSQRKKEEQDYMTDIYRDILERCEPHEFCMKIFARALYVNPNMSKQELEKLRDTLVFRGQRGWATNAKKMLKFSYKVLPREYKPCLLYLSIFLQGHKIKRSSLVGRWVAEGLVTQEDWPSSVREAERCFDTLIDQCFVYPGDIGAAGKVKSCIVDDIVHEFITEKARKEHFVESRLSRHHARHFSVLSDLRIRSSDKIERFLWKLHKSPKFPLVKVLDLEGCEESSKMNQHHLKNICNRMLLLKYLSLRNIPIIELPVEINKLHQLEVLDIRQTHVKASTTKDLMLLKLKRLLASCNINKTNESFNAVRLPHGIGKMTNMEVLSHVKASEGAELKDIGKLWQLRKLGVVVQDKEAHLKKLVQVIGDLSESLQSLSISIKPLQGSSDGILPKNIGSISPRNILESLSIRGKTSGELLPLLVKRCDQLAKVTLYNTSLNQDDLKDLGQLPKLCCVRLQYESYTKSNLTFKKKEFLKLKYLLVEGFNLTDISFEDGAAPELEKIDLSYSLLEMNKISFGNKAALKLEKIVLSNIKITSNIEFGYEAAPKLEEIVLSYTDITSITFQNGGALNLKKIVLYFTNMEFLSKINNLPGLKEVELKGSAITSASLDSLFTKSKRIAKVTLRDTLLKQGEIQTLSKKPSMRCLELLQKSCAEKQLTFNQDEFPKLNLLIVECSDITNISFTDGAAPNLEKIVWSFTEMESLSGIDNLLKLNELEFNGDPVPYQVRQDIEAHPNNDCLVFKHNKLQNEDKGKAEDDERRMFPFCWKKK